MRKRIEIVLIISEKHIKPKKIGRKRKNFKNPLLKTQKTCYTAVVRNNIYSNTKEVNGMSIFDVASYILNKSGSMTTMKLQKLCYYAQAWSLAWDEIPLFEEDFQAWANGPVCPELFNTHRGMFLVNPGYCEQVKNSIYSFTDSQKETIDKVLDYYGDKSPQWLSDLTHSELPWKNARGSTPIGAQCNSVIQKESMQQYYGGL